MTSQNTEQTARRPGFPISTAEPRPAPSEVAPTDATSAKPTPAELTLAKAAPSESKPTPTELTPAKPTPAELTPSMAEPTEFTPAMAAPTPAAPAETTSTQATSPTRWYRKRSASGIQDIAPSESALKRFLFMRRALLQAEQRALEAGDPGFAEYEVVRALQSMLAAITEKEDHRPGVLVLLRSAILYAARGLAARDAGQDSPMRFDWTGLASHPEVSRVLERQPVETQKRIDAWMADEWSASSVQLSTQELSDLQATLVDVAQGLYQPLAEAATERARLASQRLFRWAITLLALLAILGGGGSKVYSTWLRRNMALGADVAASRYTHAGLYPPTGVVDGDRKAVGCRVDGDVTPWIQIDLGRVRTVSRVVLTNRADDVSSTSLPLMVDLSIDGKTFVEYERKAERFTTWTTAAHPPAQARYVRVVLLSPATLQLTEIEVY